MSHYSDEDFRNILNTHGDFVLRIAMSKLQNYNDAEDIYQEVFVRLVRHPEIIEDEQRLRPWLYRVTINLCKDHFKSRWVRCVSLAFARLTDDEVVHEDQRVDRASLQAWEESMGREDESELLNQGMEQLNFEQRNLLYLFYYENFSVAEIAMALKLSCSTVKTRLFRAREVLKNKMKEAQSA